MPTQIGSTVSLLASFRITMGVLVTGSIKRPRILISTSIVTPWFPRVPLCPLWLKILRHYHRGHPSTSLSAGSGTQRKNSHHHLTQKAVGEGCGHAHRNIAARFEIDLFRRNEIQGLVLRGPPDPLLPRLVLPFHHYFKLLAFVLLISALLNRPLFFQQHRQPARLLFVR